MPYYKYKCDCGKEKELFKRVEDRHKVKCDCGKKMKIKISKSEVMFAEGFLKW